MSGTRNKHKEWISKADNDLGSARIIYTHNPDYFDTIAFHCQQASEKYIKAALLFLEIPFERTHDLVYLLDLLSKKVEIDSDVYNKAILLNNYSVEIRYPFSNVKITNEELKESIESAEFFKVFIISLIERE